MDYVISHAWAPCEERLEEILTGRDATDCEKSIFLWDRREGEEYNAQNYCLVHGHTPTIEKHSRKVGKVKKCENVFNVDCGCNWPQYGGRLAALCLETLEEIYVK